MKIDRSKMKLTKKKIVIFALLFVILFSIICLCVFPIATKVAINMNVYLTRLAVRRDFKLYTTPLTKDVVDNICSELKINGTSENCKPEISVYAPELFDEIKAHFNGLPNQDKIYDSVQELLGTYLTFCEKPDPDGSYVCHYDLRGDDVYPILIFFDKDNYYYRIIANIGGS